MPLSQQGNQKNEGFRFIVVYMLKDRIFLQVIINIFLSLSSQERSTLHHLFTLHPPLH